MQNYRVATVYGQMLLRVCALRGSPRCASRTINDGLIVSAYGPLEIGKTAAFNGEADHRHPFLPHGHWLGPFVILLVPIVRAHVNLPLVRNESSTQAGGDGETTNMARWPMTTWPEETIPQVRAACHNVVSASAIHTLAGLLRGRELSLVLSCPHKSTTFFTIWGRVGGLMSAAAFVEYDGTRPLLGRLRG